MSTSVPEPITAHQRVAALENAGETAVVLPAKTPQQRANRTAIEVTVLAFLAQFMIDVLPALSLAIEQWDWTQQTMIGIAQAAARSVITGGLAWAYKFMQARGETQQ